MAELNATFKFRWASFSPDPTDRTMRSSLEPIDVVVQVDVPFEHVVNANEIIQCQLDAKPAPMPILKPSGMKYLMDKLGSIYNVETDVEEDFDVEWGDEATDEWTNDDEWTN